MADYDFHIHGKPRSQEIWGSDNHRDYLKSIYSDKYLRASADSSFMVTEIRGDYVYYTYISGRNIQDTAGRPESFFAMTLTLKGQYCSVQVLYALLNQLYEQVAVPALFTRANTGVLTYKVNQLGDAQTVLNDIRNNFDKYKGVLNIRSLEGGTDSTPIASTVSLLDVDSPQFLDLFRKHRIVVSPTLPSALQRCGKVEDELSKTTSRKEKLEQEKINLTGQLNNLTDVNKRLEQELNSAETTYRSRYEEKIQDLKNRLTRAEQERNTFQTQLNSSQQAINGIQHHLNEIVRLSADRFPGSGQNNGGKGKNNGSKADDIPQKLRQADTQSSKSTRLTNLLVILGACLVIAGLAFLYRQQTLTANQLADMAEMFQKDNASSEDTESGDFASTASASETGMSDFDWNSVNIDVDGLSSEGLKIDRKYTLYIKSTTTDTAGIPQGEWRVVSTAKPDENLASGNTFSIPGSMGTLGTKVIIEFLVNGHAVKTREIKVQ